MYQSPFHLIHADLHTLEGDALRRALVLEKKKILAEFELAGSAVIEVEGRELHRQDVLTLFDALANERLLAYHTAIYNDTALLTFLEHARIAPGATWTDNPVYSDPGFLQFISPHFSEATNTLLQSAISGNGWLKEVDTLAQNTPLRLPGDTEAAFRYATRFFVEKKNELLAIRQRVDTGEMPAADEVKMWCPPEQLNILNRLPESFAALRYTLANSLNNLCVAYDQKKRNKHALVAIEQAARIDVEDEELKRLIPANLRIIRGKNARGWFDIDPKTGKRKPKLGSIIVLIVILIRVIASVNTCNDNSYKPAVQLRDLPSFPSVPESREAIMHGQSFRALIKALERPDTIRAGDTMYKASVYTLTTPEYMGDSPFEPLFTDGFNDAPVTLVQDTSASQMIIDNKSSWQVIALYQPDEQHYLSAYIPPHKRYTLRYNPGFMTVHCYAGTDWKRSVLHVYDHYSTPYLPARRVFRGGFQIVAPMAMADTTGAPLYERRSDRAVADTITLSDGPNGLLNTAFDLSDE